MNSRAFAAASGFLFLISLGVILWAVRQQQQAEAARSEWAHKEAAVHAGLARAEEKASTATREAADLEAKQARLAAAKQPAKRKTPAPPQRGPDWSAILAAHPDLQASFEKAYHADRDHVYGALYRRLNLSTDQIDRLDALMAKDVENNFDLMGSAQAQNLPNDDPAIAKLRKQQAEELHQQEAAVLGQENYAAFQAFDNQMPVRAAVSNAAQMSIYSGTPFTGEQEEQVTQLLVQSSSATQQDPGKKIDVATVNWDQALAQAQSFLSPEQIAALHAAAQFKPLTALRDKYFSQQAAAAK